MSAGQPESSYVPSSGRLQSRSARSGSAMVAPTTSQGAYVLRGGFKMPRPGTVSEGQTGMSQSASMPGLR